MVLTNMFLHLLLFVYTSRILAQGALRASPEVAFAMRSWTFLLPSFSLSFFFFSLSLRLLLLTHFRESPEAEHLFPPNIWE